MAVAVISEFNPFHNGHKYLLEKAKALTGEPVIAVMSGSFTQRGEVAIESKFKRAETALKNGADLVVELPTVYAVANAQRFAWCGVEIAKSFDCVNYLAFGCESDDLRMLINAAEAIEDDKVKRVIAEEMSNGNYYPRAVEKAVREVFGAETADMVSTPNNILAVEYLRNLRNSNIKPLPIKRVGAEHDSKEVSGEFASASQIRSLLRNSENAEKYLPVVPESITYPENLERAILYKLRSMEAEDFKKLPDVNEGLENRIINAVKRYNSVKEIIDEIKTKRYTHARIRRIITCAFLDITEELQNTPVEYVRILGFNKVGAELIRTCKLEVVTSVAKAMKSSENIVKLLKKDVFSTDMSAIAYDKIKDKGSDYTTPVVKL